MWKISFEVNELEKAQALDFSWKMDRQIYVLAKRVGLGVRTILVY